MSIKDSGKREQFPSGMQRDVTEDKIDYLMLRDGPMFERWARHLTHGAKKYDKRNWMKASSEEELMRFKESAARHFEQWLAGEADEDHAAATFFNINGACYVQEKLNAKKPSEPPLCNPSPCDCPICSMTLVQNEPKTETFSFKCLRCGRPTEGATVELGLFGCPKCLPGFIHVPSGTLCVD